MTTIRTVAQYAADLAANPPYFGPVPHVVPCPDHGHVHCNGCPDCQDCTCWDAI